MSYFFLAWDIGMMASSVAKAVVLGTVLLRVETKMAPMMTTMTTMNEMLHSTPSTPPSDPCPREGKGKGCKEKVAIIVMGGSGKYVLVAAVARIECPKANETTVVVINAILNSCGLCSS